MKRCPVCHTQVFEDMDVCYGCMHRFNREEECPDQELQAPYDGRALAGSDGAVVHQIDLPQWVVRLTAKENAQTGVNLSVQIEPALQRS